MPKMMELYPPKPVGEQVETTEGMMDYKSFLEKEKSRIESNPNRVACIHERLGYISMMVNKITGAHNKSLNWQESLPTGQKKPQPFRSKVN